MNSPAGVKIKLPTPVPQTAIPVANARRFSKYLTTLTNTKLTIQKNYSKTEKKMEKNKDKKGTKLTTKIK